MFKFEKPAVEIEKFDLADVIATSGDCEEDLTCAPVHDCDEDLGFG